MVARSTSSTREAGYTTAADSLCLGRGATQELTFNAEESNHDRYTAAAKLAMAFQKAPAILSDFVLRIVRAPDGGLERAATFSISRASDCEPCHAAAHAIGA